MSQFFENVGLRELLNHPSLKLTNNRRERNAASFTIQLNSLQNRSPYGSSQWFADLALTDDADRYHRTLSVTKQQTISAGILNSLES
jgi:hypothetical protein